MVNNKFHRGANSISEGCDRSTPPESKRQSGYRPQQSHDPEGYRSVCRARASRKVMGHSSLDSREGSVASVGPGRRVWVGAMSTESLLSCLDELERFMRRHRVIPW